MPSKKTKESLEQRLIRLQCTPETERVIGAVKRSHKCRKKPKFIKEPEIELTGDDYGAVNCLLFIYNTKIDNIVPKSALSTHNPKRKSLRVSFVP
jgi:hypothetical protein